ncbi:hypothetical protein D3C72_1274120 [compost metagenome]
MRHDNAAQRTRQIARSKYAEGLNLTQPFRDIRREEEFPHHGGKEDENDEIVKLQRAAESRERERFVVLTIQRPGVM